MVCSPSLVHCDHVIHCTVSIDVSYLSRNNLSAVSANAYQISSNEVGEVSNVQRSVPNSHRLESDGTDSRWLENKAVGFVVLSRLDYISNYYKSISDSLWLVEGIRR